MSHNSSLIPYIPLDLVEQILLNLDAQTLFQCDFLCRDWNSLITSSDFVSRNSHRTFHYSKNQVLLIETCSNFYQSYSIYWDNDQFDLFHTVQIPPLDVFTAKIMVGTSNGLICAIDILHENFALVNPTIKKYVMLPKWHEDLEFIFKYDHYFKMRSCVGFGFDNRSNDFKVIELVRNECNQLIMVWVFSYLTWSWKHLNIPTPLCYVIDDISHVFINGALHWLACDFFDNEFVLTFDLLDEVFGEILFPQSIIESSGFIFIQTAGDLLAVTQLGSHKWSVWVMKQYGVHESWTKIVAVKDDFLCGMRIPRYVSAIRKNGDIMIEMEGEQIFIYNPTANVAVYPPLRKNIAFIGYHVESLYLLEKVSTLGESINSY